MKKVLGIALVAMLWPAMSMADGGNYQIEDFIKRDRFESVKISPNGTYAAASVPLGDRTILVILKPGQKEPYGHVTIKESNTHVTNFWWVNDERILFTVGEKSDGLEKPVTYGEIWGTNADGTRQGILAGQRASMSASRSGGRAKAERSALRLIDDLSNDDENVLVSVVPFEAGEAPYTTIERMNVNTGVKRVVARAPVRGSGFLTDQQGRVRFAVGENIDYKSVLYYRVDDDSEWQLINDESVSGKVIVPMDFNRNDSVAYLLSEEKTGPDSLQAFDVATRTMKQVARDDLVSPESLVYAVGRPYPIGVLFMDGKPRVEYFESDSDDAKLHKALQASFGGDFVVSGSRTKDGSQALLLATSDRNPGDVYVFDTIKKKAGLLMSRADWFNPAKMAEMRPLVLTARDGRKMEAFLTVPAGSTGKNLPLVVNPHGGPFGPKDGWGFTDEPQLLAAYGYAVLQVNFRGSGGYGKEFMESGFKQWGGTMQDDLTDATRWAIEQDIADPKRICIYGASYGGYASLMGAAKEPDLYRCAVGYVGVYDLNMLWGRGDISQSLHGKDFLKDAVGRERLDEGSPVKLASRIKVPVFLAAGGADKRAPQDHSEAMEKALKGAGVPVETLYIPTEGHGFAKIENSRKFYHQLLTFLHRNIGGSAPAAASSASANTAK